MEIDGDSHFIGHAIEDDKRRQAFIESFGIGFLRFTNEEVYENLDGVLGTINNVALAHLRQNTDAAKSPPYEGGDLGEV